MITEFGGVRPVYGVFRAVCDARCADATPHIIYGACAPSTVHSVEIPRGTGPQVKHESVHSP